MDFEIFTNEQIKKLKDNLNDAVIALDEIEKAQNKKNIPEALKGFGELVLATKRANETLKAIKEEKRM